MAAKCGTLHIVLQDRTSDNKKVSAFPVSCGRWDCPECRKKKAAKYRDRIKLNFEGSNLYFITLTFYHSLPEESVWRAASACWNRFRTRVTQLYGRFKYVRVLEPHKVSNYPHFHILTTLYIPPSRLGSLAVQAGFGYQIRCSRIPADAAAGYVVKYLTKDWPSDESMDIRFKLRLRIVSFSRGCGWGCVADGHWHVVRISGTREQAIGFLKQSIFVLMAQGAEEVQVDLSCKFPNFEFKPPGVRPRMTDFERRKDSLPDYPEGDWYERWL